MFAPKLSSLRRRMFQQIFQGRSPEDFEDSDSAEETRSLDESSDTVDEPGYDELEEIEEQLDLYVLTNSSFNMLEFNLSVDLNPNTADRHLITTALLSSSPEAQRFMFRLHGLQDLIYQLESLANNHSHLTVRCNVLAAAAGVEINRALSGAWDELARQINRQATVDGVRVVNITRRSVQPSISPLATSVMLLTAIIHVIMGVSREYCNFILESLCSILRMLSGMQDNHSSNFIHQHLADIPTTLPTVLHQLDLPPTLDLYACCPKCSSLYPEKHPLNIPQNCTAMLDDSVCGKSLGSVQRRGTSTWVKPARRYSHMLFETWLSELLLRPGIEDLLEATRPTPNDHVLADVWDAPYLCSFPGPDEPSFFDGPPDELRLAMLLYHDFFNPYTMKTGGKLRSVGCFFMICLNLPPDVRYNASNAYLVSMVPGPHDTKLEDLNKFISPIVENMLELFSPGIWVSKTHKYPQGRKVRAGIAIKSLDTPAARGMGGCASHSHTCFCYLCTGTLSSIDMVDLSSVQLRTTNTHRQQVELWVNAQTMAACSKLYAKHGVRYVDWLRFSWWNPFSCIVVGPMHWTKNILEKQLRENMNWSWTLMAGVPTSSTRPLQALSQYEYEWGLSALTSLSITQLEGAKLTAPIIRHLCSERRIFIAGLAGPRLVQELNRWRLDEGWVSPNGNVTARATAQHDGIAASVARARYHIAKASSIGVIRQNSTENDLAALCKMLGQPSHGSKDDTIRRLADYYSTTRVPQVVNAESKAKAACAVLGKEVLTEVQLDMGRTTLPSWLKYPPKNFATISHGKLQAEEYKSLAMVSFTITLVRLWGTLPSGPLRERLDHFLHLIIAVRILAYQSLIPSDVIAFEYHYGEYIKRLTTLYPDSSRTSVQHMGLHIPSFLRALGPSTRFSESTCELFNGILQGINTNFKFGDLELTMHWEFVMAARLKGIIEQKGFAEDLGAFGQTVQRFLEQHVPSYGDKSTWRTTHSRDPLGLTADVVGALGGWTAARGTRPLPHRLFACRKLQRGNVIYTPFNSSTGDSCVLYCSPQHNGAVIPGRIDFILQEPADMTPTSGISRILLVVHPFMQLSPEDSFRDPYFNHPIIGRGGAGLARLYYDSVDSQAQIIEPKDLVSHAAICTYDDPKHTMSKDCIVVLSLDLKHERYA